MLAPIGIQAHGRHATGIRPIPRVQENRVMTDPLQPMSAQVAHRIVADQPPAKEMHAELPPELPVNLPLDVLQQSVGSLVRQYVQGRSAALADRIARYSAALALHPALRDEPEQCAGFCRLSRHWRLLAEQCRLAPGA
jgi:hypothetical protein